ncbi:MAG: hypothetical protein J2P45_16235 [Candidatus Dormibacteraeota bacterium]|nr:hypothetical protein [Candidatus Dormibacteraeota bacterium]
MRALVVDAVIPRDLMDVGTKVLVHPSGRFGWSLPRRLIAVRSTNDGSLPSLR